MKKRLDWRRTSCLLAQVLLIGFWYFSISRFELYSVDGDRFNKFDGLYLICAALAAAGMAEGVFRPRVLVRRERIAAGMAGGLYGLMTVLANYPVFEEHWWAFVPAVLGGFAVGWQVLTLALRRLPLRAVTGEGRDHPVCFFLLTFGTIWGVYLLYFFTAAYPGLFSRDSFSAVIQCVSGQYDNTSPFWHTMVVKLCLEIGSLLGLDLTGSVAVYGIFQSLAMAAVFAYVLLTLYQAGVPKWCMACTYLIYGFAAYNIAYSVTLWKDIPFTLGLLAMICALYRILKKIGKSHLNYVIFTVGALLFSMMRTNGWYSCLAMTLVLLPSLKRLEKKLLVILCAVLAVGWICNNPVLDALGVSETDYVEALAIPFQQVTRVVAEEQEVPEDDMEMIEAIFDIGTVKTLHDPLSVNNMKFEAFRHEQRDYLRDNMASYARLWLRLGLRHPWTYLKAWIDETVGYWNAGYNYWIYPDLDLDMARGEALGILRPALDNLGKTAFDAFFHLQHTLPLLAQPLFGIGFQVWIFLACLTVCGVQKREEFFLGIPILVILVGLWAGTPVFAEFRYAYPVFAAVPFLLPVTVYRIMNN